MNKKDNPEKQMLDDLMNQIIDNIVWTLNHELTEEEVDFKMKALLVYRPGKFGKFV